MRVALKGQHAPIAGIQSAASVLQSLLREAGFELVETSCANFLIALDHSESDYKEFISCGGKASRAILIRSETPAVFPGQFQKKIRSLYGLVITLGGDASIEADFYFPHAYVFSPNPGSTFENVELLEDLIPKLNLDVIFDYESWMNRKEFVIVGANKASFAKIENYSFRRLVAAKVSTQDLDIYGGMWDGLTRNIIGNRWELFKYAIKTRQSVSIINLNRGILRKYPSVKGPVKNKHLTLLDYKFNVIIENSPHYLTEKIIDSFLAGSIPVFCGPNLEFFGIPEDLVISINSDMTECEIKEKFDTIKGNEYSEKLLAIKDFVTRSEFVEKFSASAIMAKVLKVFESYIKSHED